jgi:hypothetical protein
VIDLVVTGSFSVTRKFEKDAIDCKRVRHVLAE